MFIEDHSQDCVVVISNVVRIFGLFSQTLLALVGDILAKKFKFKLAKITYRDTRWQRHRSAHRKHSTESALDIGSTLTRTQTGQQHDWSLDPEYDHVRDRGFIHMLNRVKRL